jgi:hypothetical protein
MDIKMTSVENELGGKVDFAEITAVLTSHFDTHFAQRTYALQIAGGAKNDQDYLT